MDNCRAAGGCSPSDGDCPLSVFLSTIAIRHVMNPPGGECRGDITQLTIDNGQWTIAVRRGGCVYKAIIVHCQLSIVNCQLKLTSQFPDLPFSANAHFRKIVPIRKTRVKYFKIRPSERIIINPYSHNYTVSNAKKASAKPIFRIKSTCDWLRTDERLPPYRRVRTVVVVRPYENSHLSSFFRARRDTIPDV